MEDKKFLRLAIEKSKESAGKIFPTGAVVAKDSEFMINNFIK